MVLLPSRQVLSERTNFFPNNFLVNNFLANKMFSGQNFSEQIFSEQFFSEKIDSETRNHIAMWSDSKIASAHTCILSHSFQVVSILFSSACVLLARFDDFRRFVYNNES